MSVDSTFRLGFFTQVHGELNQPAAQVYAQLIDTIQAAEDLGYETVWLGQHHFGKDRLPSPLVLLAAAAAKTRRIGLGTAVIALPLEDPIRLAEDAAVLDEIADGRVELGVGSGGGDPQSFVGFGYRLDERRVVYDEKLAVLHTLLEGGSITGEEEPRRLYPPAPGLRERIWQTVGTVELATAAARAGDGLLVGMFNDPVRSGQLAKITAYRNEWARTQSGREPRIGGMRFTYVGDTRESIERQVENELNAFRAFSDKHNPDMAGLSTSQYLRRVTRYGTVTDIIGDLRDDPALVGHVTHFLPTVGLYPPCGNGTPGAELDIRRLEVFATEIAPALGWVPPGR